MPRAFVLVIDACGVGALPDAADYGDEGTDTLGHLAGTVGGLNLPTLAALGLGNAHSILGLPPVAAPALHGRLHAIGPGKDSAAGHRELMGLVATRRPPTYPDGFPPEVVALISRAAGGRGVIGNRICNGIEAIESLGEAQLAGGELIVYTSQDSVLQIAAHVDVVPPVELYAICAAVRHELPTEHAVGRVIARPFTGAPGAFTRTGGRRDFALMPSGPSHLDALRAHGIEVHAVGKVAELFGGQGIDVAHHGATNAAALEVTSALLDELTSGFVFTNLIDTDQVYGHRHDVPGFTGALERIDAWLADALPRLRDDDLFIITGDHGVDLTSPRTDHTREHVPLLARFPGHDGRRHDGPLADVGASVLLWLAGAEAAELPGFAFTPAAPGA